jgi:hypothetical protein
MIDVELAQKLRDAGVRWDPVAGDRFVVIDPPMPDEVYVVSDMTVDVHRFSTGTVIGFNGTTEWALDSIEHRRALWLPREEQLRRLLGGTFVALTRTDDGWAVTTRRGDTEFTFEHGDAEQAYGLALLALIVGVAELPR